MAQGECKNAAWRKDNAVLQHRSDGQAEQMQAQAYNARLFLSGMNPMTNARFEGPKVHLEVDPAFSLLQQSSKG